jgi:purine-nucleoside phosphorylase
MSQAITYELVAESVAAIRARSRRRPTVGLILGSGLGALADQVGAADAIPYGDIPHFPRSTVAGHSGRLLLGRLGRAEVLLMQGRVHFYEGYTPAEITLPVRAMQQMGIDTLIVTNAAGGVNASYQAGDLMAISDHLNLAGMAGNNPLRGPNDERWGPRFPGMSRAYDPALLQSLAAVASSQGVRLHQGVYAMVAGPNFETPAEVRMLRGLGADAVGMSTVPEVIVARHSGLRVLGISMISNVAIDRFVDDISLLPTHEEVLAAGASTVPVLARLIEGLLAQWE